MYRKLTKLHKESLPGYSLQELLVVLLIIGILLLIALPNLMPLVTKAKSIEAQTQLKHLHSLEKMHFMQYSTYTNELRKIGFESPTLISEGGSAKYEIRILSSSPSGFVAQATAVVDFDGDGIFNVWQIDQDLNLEEIVPD